MFNDFRFAIRMLGKNPGFVAVAVLSLAIGIGANSAIFSFADALLLRPMPVLHSSRVVRVNPVKAGILGSPESISYPDYVDLRDHNHSFDGLIASAYSPLGFAPDSKTQPQMKFGMIVSGNFFRVLGVEPSIGRGFRAEEDRVAGRDAVVILSHDLWATEFSADPAAVGRIIRLNGSEFTIVGVAPETFTGLDMLKPALFVPIAMYGGLRQSDNLIKRDARWLDVRGRLKPGLEIAQAKADVASLVAGLRSQYPKTDENLQLTVKTELQLRAENSPPDTVLVVMLGVLSICVLLVACANVAGLQLGRAGVRSREIAVRLALGGSRLGIVRQLMVENLLLAIGGALAGLAIAVGATEFFSTLPLPTDIPVDLNFRLDDRVLYFTLAVCLASTFVFGLAPALQGSRLDLIRALKEREATASRAGRLWGRNLIVSGQVALSLVLLITSSVMVAGFRTQLAQGPGFRTDHLQFMGFDPSLLHYSDAERHTFYRQLLDQTRQAPDVKSAALTANTPLVDVSVVAVIPEGHELKRGEHAIDTTDNIVSPGYFKTIGTPLVRGRDFLDTDTANTPQVAIVNEQFASHYWPKQDPIGKRIRLHDATGKQVEVVGVAKVAKYIFISESPLDYIFLPFSQNPQGNMRMLAQSKNSNSAALVPVLRQIVQRLDRNMPVFDVRTMESLYQMRAVSTPAMITQTVTALGLMGLVLAVVGLYGVVSYTVSKRSREFGIRMAVGADRRSVVRMVLQQGLILGTAGLAVGLVLGIVVARALANSAMFSFPTNVLPFVAVSILLLLSVTFSAYVPARRASLIDPMRALREE